MTDDIAIKNEVGSSDARTLVEMFEAIAKPDEDGFSDPIPLDLLERLHPGKFLLGNGGGWCRSDGPLGIKYIVRRVKVKGVIVAVKLDGFNRNPAQRSIRSSIRKEITKQQCAVLATSKPQVDHKDGTYTTQSNQKAEDQKPEDFQPLSQAANSAKRQHCADCLSNWMPRNPEVGKRKRFDARRLGYSAGWYRGDESTNNCVGCYWHDPCKFNQIVSKNFRPGGDPSQHTGEDDATN